MTNILYFNFLEILRMKDIRRRCNKMVDLSKFTTNKNILSKIDYNQFCN